MLARSTNRAESMLRYWAWVTLAGCWTANTLMVSPAMAAPKGARVARGDVAISQQGGTTTIRASHNSIINYRSFDIGAAETVQFVQPNAAARVLNRIESSTPTRIDGKLLANGQVYLVNPSGIMFGQGSVINVGQLYAAAGNLSDANFLANINQFTHLTGTVVNQGQINAAAAALIGRHVVNDGTIDTTNYVVMAAGNDVLIGEQGGNVYLKVTGAAGDAASAASPSPAPASITNTGSIHTKRARLVAADMFGAAIHNRGRVKASDIAVRSDGPVTIAGQLDASATAAGKTGGSVEVTGKTVEVAGATIDASGPAGGGKVRIGGDVQGQGDLPRALATTVSSDSTIRADATTQGDGGSIVIWSDGLTRVNGLLSARGGTNGGDGGFIETSGHYLQLNVVPLLDAPQGDGGTWLLDPEDITIDAVTANISTMVMGTTTTFSPTLDDTVTTIDVALINMALDAGNDVVIKTASGGSDTGIITLASAILKSADVGGDGSTLTLMADADIVINSPITSTTGVLNVSLMAVGNVDINAMIDGNGGSFMSSGVDFDNTGGAVTAATIDINHSGAVIIGADLLGTASASVRSGNGAVGGLDIAAAVVVRGTTITLRAGDDMAGSDAITISTMASFQGAAGAGTSPTTFTLRQDDDVVDATIPAAAQFAGGLGGVTYSLQSDDASVTLDTAGKLNAAALTITAATGVDINAAITNTTSFASSGTTFDNTGGVITAPTISIDHSTTVTVGASLLGTTSATVRSGNGGAGDLTVSAVTVRGGTISLTAGSGGGGMDSVAISAMAALQGSAGAGTSPATFSLVQDASIADAGIPAAAQFGGGVAGMSYTLRSVEGSVTIATASKVAGAALTVLAADDITVTANIAPASLSATATAGDIDLMDVTTTGSQTYSAGLDFTAGTLTAGTTIAITFDTTGLDGVGMTGDLIAGTSVTITGGAGDDDFTLAGGGVVGTGAITFNAGAGDDSLTLDFSGGNPIPAGGVTFNGQGNDPMGGDMLILDGPDIGGSPAVSITHTFTNANDGSVAINSSTIAYTGLEPIDDNLNAAARVFTFGSGVDAIVIEDIGGADGISRIRSNNSETVDFVNPTTSLTVNAGGGADTITLDALDSAFGAAIALNGDAAGDAITLNAVTGGGGITVSGGAGNDTLTLSAAVQAAPGTITFNGGTENDSLSLTGAMGPAPSGTIVFNGDGGDDSLTLDFDMGTPVPDGGLTFNGGAGGSDTLTLNGPKPVGVIPVTITHTADTSVVIDAETVLYSGLETINDNLLAENRVFNYGATADVITISDDGTAADGRSRIARTGGETINFFNPIVSLTVNTAAGNDSITLNGLDTQVFDPDGMPTLTAFAGTVTLNGQGDMDTIAVLGVTGLGLHTADGGSESDTVVGPNVANVWTINADAGSVAGTHPFDFDNIENLTGGSSTDEFDFTAMTALTGAINGSAGVDRLDYSAIATARSITLTAIGTVDGFMGTEALIPGGFNNINELLGTAATDSLTGAGIAAAWTLRPAAMASDYIAGGRTLTFTSFETLTGGSLSDTFTLTGAFTGSVAGGGSTDTLIGAGGTNTFTITASNAGSVTNLSGGFTSIENLSGGSGADTFKFVGSSAAISGSIDGNGGSDTLDFSMNGGGAVTIDLGGSGSTSIGGTISEIETIIGSSALDTLIGPNATTTWSITGPNAGSVAGVAFSSFENLTGGTQDDTFAFIGAGATLSGRVDGGAHVIEDTLDYSAFVGNVTVNLENGTATNITGGFINIEMWIGNGGGSNIIGKDIDNLWIITGTNTGTVNGEPFITFGDITGGNANDTFDFRAGGSVSGSIFGNGQTAADVITYANNGGVAVTVNLETRTAPGIGVTFNGIERIIGSTSAADVLIGDNLPRVWTIHAPNAGSVNGTVFDSFENLTGGTADDRFSILTGGSISGNLAGGAHSTGDSLDYSAFTGTVDVNLGTSRATAIGGTFSQIESFTGNGATSTITGAGADNIWTIDGHNSGDVNGIPFFDFANLVGGSANDAFNFTTAAGAITGNLSGGGQTAADTLSYKDNGGGTVIVNLQTRTGTSIGGVFSDVEIFIGNSLPPASGNSTLIGPNTASTWVIDGPDSGTVNGTAFFCFGNLTGGSGNDAFNFTGPAGSLSGNIAGSGNSAAGDVLSYFANGGGAVVVDLENSTGTSIGGAFSGIESFIGNSQAPTPGSSTLIGFDAATTWVINGLDSGTVNGTPFSGFSNLTGGSGDDAFNFTTAAGILSGSILGGGQSSRDSLSYAANGGGSVMVNLQTSTATSIGGTFGQIENLIGNGAPSTLIGPNANTTWTIDGANAGSVAGFTFSGFANLTGGTGDDTFALTGNSASLSGNLVGGAQATQDSLSYAAVSGAVSVNLQTGVATSIGGTLSQIEHLIGNGNSSTIIGPNVNTTWTINGPNAGSVGPFTFSAFGNLTGGSANDTFNFTGAAASLTGNLAGSGGADAISYAANGGGAIVVNLQTSKTTNVSGTFSSIESFTGSASGADSITGGNVANTWTINGANSGNVNGINFAAIENLIGGTNNDAFNFTGAAGAISGNITGGGQASQDVLSFAANGGGAVTVNLQTSTATSIGGTFSGIERFAGSGVSGAATGSTLIGFNADATWVISAADAGTVNAIPFSGFANLTGGSGNDAFNFTGAAGTLSGNLVGGGNPAADTLSYAANGGGAVTVNLQAGTATSIGGTFSQIEAFIGSGNGGDTLIGEDAVNAWSINAANGGTLNVFTFAAFENLTGGSAADTFTFAAGGSISGVVNGTAGSDALDFTAIAGGRIIQLNTNGPVDGFAGSDALITGGFTNIDALRVDSATTDLLTGVNAAATWNVTSAGGTYTSGGQALTFSGFEQLTGGSAGDAFTLDFEAGSPIPAVGLILNGAGGGDSLTLAGGGSIASIVHDFDAADSGRIAIGTSMVNYSQFATISDQLPAAARTFNFNVIGSTTVTLDTDGSLGRIQSAGGSVPASFAAPTASVTINTGAGDDTFTISNLPAGFNTVPFTFNTGKGAETFTISAAASTFDATFNSDDSVIVLAGTTGIGLTFNFSGDGGAETFDADAITAKSLTITGTDFDDVVTLNGDIVTTSGGVAVTAKDIITHNITSAGGITLTHLGTVTEVPIENTDESYFLPDGTITINSDLIASGDITLGASGGLAGIPATASIFANGDLTIMITGGFKFELTPNSKLSVNGALDIDVPGGQAIFGDLSAFDTITVTADTITIRMRDPANVLGLPPAEGQPNRIFKDKGTDLVSNDGINFSVRPVLDTTAVTVDSARRLRLGTVGSRNISSNLRGSSNVSALALRTPLTQEQFLAQLDILVDGVSIVNTAQVITTALPEQLPPVLLSTSVGQADRETLRFMGVPAEKLTDEELAVAASMGLRFYRDVNPPLVVKDGAIQSPSRVTVNRLRPEQIASAIEIYKQVLPEYNEAPRALRQALADALAAWRQKEGKAATDPVDPISFRASLPADGDLAKNLDKLSQVFEHLAKSNLSLRELNGSKETIARYIVPDGMTVGQLIAAIENKQPHMTPDAKTDAK